MSFSSDIKERLCSVKITCNGCIAAETAGILRFLGAAPEDRIKITTENASVAKRIENNLYEGFGFRKRALHKEKSRAYTFLIDDIREVENIRSVIYSNHLCPFQCCKKSFVRGAFLGGGSVNDPKKNYHLEFDSRSDDDAEYLREILSGAGFAAKITSRKGRRVVYIKEMEQIAGVLGYIGADNGALEIFGAQVEKQVRNDINRRVNFENANTDKTAKAASKHIYAIQKIKSAGKWRKLPDVLKEIGELRLEYPEIGLKELGEKTTPPIGKSGVNHRLNRILRISEEI